MLCPSCGKTIADGATVCPDCGQSVKPLGMSPVVEGMDYLPTQAEFASKKMIAGICGILLGSIGVHKFILGNTKPGLTMLLVSVLTCSFGALIMGPIGLIEGIIYLTKSDAEFYRQYAVEKKGWF